MIIKDKKIYFYISLSSAVFILFIAFPHIAFSGAKTGLKLWAMTILPGLFPAAVVSSCIMAFSSRWKKSSRLIYIYITIAGLFCGYPLGAILASGYCSQLKRKDKFCEMIMPFCNVSSPSFIFNYIFMQLPAPYNRTKILLCIYMPVFLCIAYVFFYNILFCKTDTYQITVNSSFAPPCIADVIDNAIIDTAKNMIKLGGYIVIFSCISSYINIIPFQSRTLPSLICGFIEITNGIYLTGQLPVSSTLITRLILIINSFGGLSTIMQTMGMIKGSGLSIKKYIYGKLICTFLTYILSLFIF